MLISSEKKFIFVHICKTGGTSICHSLHHLCEPPDQHGILLEGYPHDPDDPYQRRIWPHHFDAQKIRWILGSEKFEQYFSFAVVRNPFDWLVSSFFFLNPHLSAIGNETMRKFEAFLYDTNSWVSTDQWHFVCDAQKNLIVDDVLRYESLPADFHRVLSKLDIKDIQLPRLNTSWHHHYSTYFQDIDMRRHVEDKVGVDLEVFGYAFEDKSQKAVAPRFTFESDSSNIKLTIVIPHRNHGVFIQPLVESILQRSSKLPIEVLIVDDCSDDGSDETVRKLENRFQQVKAIYLETQMGVVHAVNLGIQKSRGELVSLRAADDVPFAGFHEEAIMMLEKYPETGVFVTDPMFFVEDESEAIHCSLFPSLSPCYLSPQQLISKIRGGFLHTVSCIFRKEPVIEAGGFLPGLAWASDWLLTLVVAFRHGIYYLPEPLAAQRLSPDSYSGRAASDSQQQRDVWSRVIELLRTQYRDVLPHFMASGVMNSYIPDIMDVVLSDEKHWNAETLLLMLRPAWEWNKQMDEKQHGIPPYQQYIPPFIRKALSLNKNKISEMLSRNGGCDCYVYGAGNHTRYLLEQWSELGLPEIHGIITSDLPSKRSFQGLRWMWLKDVELPGLVILSSRNHEREMARMIREQYPEVSILAIWEPHLSSEAFRT